MQRFVRDRAIGLCVALLLLAALSVSAQDQAEQTPSVGEIVKLMVGSYKGLKSYQHSGQWATEMQMGGTPLKQEIPVDVTYAAGSRFKIVSSMWQIVCDGKLVTVYVPALEQYTVREFGPDFWKEEAAMTGVLPGGAMRPDEFFASEDPVAEYVKLVLEAKVKGGETAGDYDCWLVEGHAKIPEGSPVQGDIPLKVWHRKQDGLVVQVSADLTEFAKAQMAAMGQDAGTLDSVALRCTAGKIILNADLPEDAFVFQPPAGAQKVDQFAPPETVPEQQEQVELEGKPAPDSE